MRWAASLGQAQGWVKAALPSRVATAMSAEPPWVWRVVPACAFTVLLALVGVVTLADLLQTYSTITHNALPQVLVDFKIFYTGGRDFLAGGSFYRASATLPFPRIDGPNNVSPFGGLLFALLARLPLERAALLWESVGLITFLPALWTLGRTLGYPSARWQAVLLFAVVLTAFPFSDTLWLGQYGLFITTLEIMAWSAARRGAPRLAGVLLGLALVLRWHPLPILLCMAVGRRWVALAATLLTAALVSTATALVCGPGSFLEFARLIGGASAGAGGSPYDSSLRSALARLAQALPSVGGHLTSPISILGALLSLAVLGLTLWASRAASFDVGVGLAVVCALLVLPNSWMHYHVELLLPMAIIAREHAWPALSVLLFWLATTAFGLDTALPPLLFGSLLTGSLVLLYATLWGMARRNPAAAVRIPTGTVRLMSQVSG